jgi:fructan beta-fructosidase
MTTLPEPFRPRFHFSPHANWCNDPNGLVWFDGEYHLFYQYNPLGDVWGHMSWGHAISTDLLTWTEMPVAIAEDDDGMIFSGSAVYDVHDTSGLGTKGAAPLVAIYTRHVAAIPQQQTQCLAFSTDRGRSWTKYAGNPVLDAGLAHFRDPKVFWHAPSEQWVMIVAVSDKNFVSFYASGDLKAWRHLSDFGPAGGGGALWECPDLFTIPVIGGAAEEKWLLKVDMFEGGVCGGSSAQYFVGHVGLGRFREGFLCRGELVEPAAKRHAAALDWLDERPCLCSENAHLALAWRHDGTAQHRTSQIRG